MLRLARDDRSEEVLVRMLLHSEDDLNETKEPMAFPIYGRGRVLYALVGKGINDETVDDACSFLTGPCSCIIKEQNPGLDLLLSVDWERLVNPIMTAGLEMPELTGAPSRSGAAPLKASPGRERPESHINDPLVFKSTLITLGGIGVAVLCIGSLILLRKRE